VRLRRGVKRGFDVVTAAVGLAILSPLVLVIWVVVRWRLGSPALFRQCRTGRGRRRFSVLKFRTMTDRRNARGELLPDHRRLTRLGRLLRRLSLDELPQLVNVLRGDMSIVGPRPLLPQYDRWYTTEELRRFEVRPGITGLAQVMGRNTLAWGARLRLDVRYVQRWSLWLDLVIIVRTFGVVFGREGVADQRSLMSDLDQERSEAMTDELVLDAGERELLRAAS
jgi:lipopolysaccharide/colanic/teichoic acid biosynthesis glycosyltransferase